MMQDALMNRSWQPTWELVLEAATHLAKATGEFRLQDLVAEVQRVDPARGRGTIQPVVQRMTVNAGTGPPNPCEKRLVRTATDNRTSRLAPPTRRPSLTVESDRT